MCSRSGQSDSLAWLVHRHSTVHVSPSKYRVERYNCRPRKNDMFPLPFNENRFSFFCCKPSTSWPVVYKSQERQEPTTMSESDTIFDKRDRRCTAIQLMLFNDPSYDDRTMPAPTKCKSRLPRIAGTKSPATLMVFGVVSREGHIMPPHIFEVGLKVNTKVYLDVLKSVVVPMCNKVAGGKPWVCPKRPRLGFRRSATTLYHYLTGPLLLRPEPAGLLRLVIRQEHHQHDLPQQPA